MTFRYLSVCSGIEAASVAWKPLGWKCAGVSEIDKFPRAVLQHRLGAVPVDADHRWQQGQNFTPLFGDFTQIEAHHVGPVHLLVGGTPCQSFSIAGKRLGLDDPRGNLTLEFFALAERVRPSWIVWENVPGVLSHDDGRTFGAVLGLMGECGFRWAYRVLDAQYVRVGRFGRAVPQRRRRVFLVGYSGTADINPAAVLFDRESLRGNPAPRREAGESTPANAGSGAASGGGSVGSAFRCQNEQAGIVEDDCAASLRAKGTTTDERSVGAYVAAARMVAFGESVDDGAASAMKARDFKDATDLVAHALRGEGFDASEDGTGRGTPIVPVAIHSDAIGRDGISKTAGADAAGVVRKRDAGLGIIDDGSVYSLTTGQPHVVAFTAKDHGGDAVENISPTLRAGGHTGSHANAGVMPAIAYTADGLTGDPLTASSDRSYTNEGNNFRLQNCVDQAWGARRLTPTECARLQGFPDDWARIPWRGKPAEECPDGPQYKAFGNSMALPPMIFIGERIEAIRAATGGQEQ